jgi:putative colanic acid biosynthesis acetyltransferase WcaB
LLREDWRANDNPKSKLIVAAFRMSRPFWRWKRFGIPGRLASLPVRWGYQFWCWFLGCEIPLSVEAGPELRVYHGQGLVVHKASVLGSGVTLRQNTTLGTRVRDGVESSAPVLGDGVDVGANVVILGPCTIGANAVIGAGSVVVGDVPAGAVVAGNPARVIASAGDEAAAREDGS